MTILEAITDVLTREGTGLTCKEITNRTNRILSNNLYVFNTPDPNSIVRQSLRRHCQGLNFASAHPVKHFTIISGQRQTAIYCLLDQAPAASSNKHPAIAPISSESDLLPEEKMQKYYEVHRGKRKNSRRLVRVKCLCQTIRV